MLITIIRLYKMVMTSGVPTSSEMSGRYSSDSGSMLRTMNSRVPEFVQCGDSQSVYCPPRQSGLYCGQGDKSILLDLVPQYRDKYYEEQLISRYNQHQISETVRRFPASQSPEPSVSPLGTATDRSSSTGSCVSSFSEPRKKKILDLEDDGTFPQRYSTVDVLDSAIRSLDAA